MWNLWLELSRMRSVNISLAIIRGTIARALSRVSDRPYRDLTHAPGVTEVKNDEAKEHVRRAQHLLEDLGDMSGITSSDEHAT
jgi:hypothetical protein